jgi:hypothetical protein
LEGSALADGQRNKNDSGFSQNNKNNQSSLQLQLKQKGKLFYLKFG